MLDLLLKLTQYDGQLFLNDPPDSIRFQNRIQEKVISDISRIQIPLANSATNATLIPASVDYLIIAVDQQVTALLNGSVTPVTLTPQMPGTKAIVFLNKGTVSSLSITNNSGSIANLDVITIIL
jgi:hypothetical protein